MNKYIFAFLLVFNYLNTNAFSVTSLGIIPAPAKMEVKPGHFEIIPSGSTVVTGFKGDNERLNVFANEIFGLNKSLGNSKNSFLEVSAGKLSGHPEGYHLTIDQTGVRIVANTARGAFYGLQTLAQIRYYLGVDNNKLPFLKIEDYPRYDYRGLHLDVARHHFPVSFIKQYIDMMAFYKLNNFHWHLTEDQGWRIEIKKYPKLTSVGGFRDQTLMRYLKDTLQHYDGVRYGGFYSQNDIREVVSYATSRYINVIPEIEMPGHSQAALAAYPNLACGNDRSKTFKVAEKWGVFEDVYCAGKEETFVFLENVLDEVITLFPSKLIHIGGDESPKSRWKKCQDCQSRMKNENLKDEHELQSYFIQRIEKYLNKKGRSIIGWDEILEGGLAPNATVMSWRGTKGGIAAAKQSHPVVMTPASYLYFDKRESLSPEEPLTIGGYLPLSTVYNYDPTPNELSDEEKKYILGVQANLWSEYIKTPQKAWYMLYPRIFALSEIAWSSNANKNWEDFSEQRVPLHLQRLDQKKMQYRVPEPIGLKDSTIYTSEYEIDYKIPVKGANVYYTLNGKIPYDFDYYFQKPTSIKIPKGEERVIKSVVITDSGRRSIVVTTTLKNTND